MGQNSNIEWTQHTFNPWSGCTKVSPGCANCYAAALPPSMRRGAEWGDSADRVVASDAYWREPQKWDRAAAKAGERHRVFCASVADVFEDRADLNEWRQRLFTLIRETPNLDWLLLTKRPNVAVRWEGPIAALPNVWVGASVENQRTANERIPWLLQVPAAVRFLSMEPLLGAVDLRHMDVENHPAAATLSPIGAYFIDALTGRNTDMGRPCPEVRRIDWVIVGGESGRRARPMHPDWARSIRDQCQAAGVPFFFKQMGEWAAEGTDLAWSWRDATGKEAVWLHPSGVNLGAGDGARRMSKIGKHAAGRLLDGRTWDEVPHVHA